MKEHERIPVAMLLVPGTDTIEQYVAGHTGFLPSSRRVCGI
jgi:hypothetical protein